MIRLEVLWALEGRQYFYGGDAGVGWRQSAVSRKCQKPTLKVDLASGYVSLHLIRLHEQRNLENLIRKRLVSAGYNVDGSWGVYGSSDRQRA